MSRYIFYLSACLLLGIEPALSQLPDFPPPVPEEPLETDEGSAEDLLEPEPDPEQNPELEPVPEPVPVPVPIPVPEPDPQLEPVPVPVPIPVPVPEPELVPELEQQPALPPINLINPSYVLGPGDEIAIAVFEYDELTGQKTILPDGSIGLPLIGRVMAANLTPEQLAAELTELLHEWLVNPVVTVEVTRQRPVLVNVAGEVRRPGPIQSVGFSNAGIANASPPQLPTLSSAIVQAGGITQDADISRILLRRYNPAGNSPVLVVNLWDALVSERAARDIVLRDGDSIFIPKLQSYAGIDRSLLARSSIAPGTVRVRVVGEVKRPGELEVPPNSSISSAVAIAGGPTDDAKLVEVVLVRLDENGSIQQQVIDLSNLTATNPIQEADVIIVPKKRISRALDLADRINNPANLFLTILRGLF